MRPAPRPPWKARVIQTHRWRYDLVITSGGLQWGWEGCVPIGAWGSRARAERKAKRIVDKLNRRDAREIAADQAATEVH